jgi:hypothetical protein
MEGMAEVYTAMTMAPTGRWHAVTTGRDQHTMTLREFSEMLERI